MFLCSGRHQPMKFQDPTSAKGIYFTSLPQTRYDWSKLRDTAPRKDPVGAWGKFRQFKNRTDSPPVTDGVSIVPSAAPLFVLKVNQTKVHTRRCFLTWSNSDKLLVRIFPALLESYSSLFPWNISLEVLERIGIAGIDSRPITNRYPGV
jgi:hypothetical protein